MDPDGSLPHSQDPATCPHSEPDQSRPCPHPTSWRSILTLSSHLRLRLPSGSFPQVYPTEPCTHHSSPPDVLHSPSISFLSMLAYIRKKLCKTLIESKSRKNKMSICELRTVHLEMLTEVLFIGATIFFLNVFCHAPWITSRLIEIRWGKSR